MATLSRPIYNFIFRKNYIFVGSVFVAAFALETGYDVATDRLWDSFNKGRQWKDIRAKYVADAGDDE